jgi:8-oxo-dGTP pyrophosphatase MutT (NUDIX family)
MKELTWKLLQSTQIINDPWLSLRSDVCATPEGHIIEPYYVFEYPAWVNVVALTEQQDVILIQQYRHGLGQTLLELPCGVVEASDASPEDAARRELLEETGYAAHDLIPLARLSPNPANHTNLTHSFLALNVQPVAAQALDPSEVLNVVLLPLNEVVRRVRECAFIQALHTSALLLALIELGQLSFQAER